MLLSSLVLTNFRKHTNSNFRFSSGLNYIVGKNSVGKTSILEAIYYLCSGRSIFAKDNEIVSFDKNHFEIEGIFNNKIENKVRVFFKADENKKYYLLNGKQVIKSSEIIGKFPLVTLTPEDHQITQGSPADRRKFFDSVIAQASKTYLDLLLDYNKILKHRAVILNHLFERATPTLIDELESWTENLINCGSQIIRFRKNFIKDFNLYLIESYKSIMDSNEIPVIKYLTVSQENDFDEKDEMKKLLEKNRQLEINRKLNLIGPHRDDYLFEINNINLRKFGSQGQNKTFQITLKFAEFFYLKEITNDVPIFLMDDVFGELDSFRANRVSKFLKNLGQAFLTLTDFSNLNFLSKSENDLIINLPIN
jgi:DNA replication and repair protein RecF